MKDALRGTARGRIRSLTPAERERGGTASAARVWSVAEITSARRLLLYAALPSEVPTDKIAEEARRRGIEVIYPRCLVQTQEMALHRVAREADLITGSFGIREPEAASPGAAHDEIDVALVPGLAWDRQGGRLGRGAGYYDRLLAHPAWRGFSCGLFFGVQEAATRLPSDPWDAPLDAVVTEREVWRKRRA
ncbi:5-formyltetrahydrofolate cyclo-ligase [soil metagenome]